MIKQIKIRGRGAAVVDIDEIAAFQGNLKSLTKERFAKLRKEILETGFAFPIHVWDSGSGLKAIGGHQRLRVLRELRREGYEIPPVPVTFVEAYTHKEAKRRVLQDVAQYGDVDRQGLYEFVIEAEIEIADLSESFEIPELSLDMGRFKDEFFTDPASESGAEDEVPDPPQTPCTRLGDIWTLGRHRLMCGDAGNSKAIEQLINGEKVDAVYADPPYGISLDTRRADMKGTWSRSTRDYKPVLGDDADFDPLIILNRFTDCKEVFLWGADYYAERLPDKNQGSWVVWDKRLTEELDAMWGSQFELCWSKNKHKREIARVTWAGVCGHSKRDDGDQKVHPTMKPVKLHEWFFSKSWFKDLRNIVDPFGGSGSTMIACEKTGRACFMMELDPGYCDVILSRWSTFTGQDPIRADGALWSSVKNIL